MLDEFKDELIGNPISFICSKWILDRIPFVFKDDRITFIKWKEELALRLGVDAKAMVLTESASCGFSVTRQKSFLIDTILNEYPIPEIYMQETVDDKGKAKYIIVDGQQRTRAVLEYIEGKYCIDAKESPDLADLYFEDLSGDQKKDFYRYNFVIRVLPDVPDEELRTIFQRLNKNVVALNKQELRQATYWGPFINGLLVDVASYLFLLKIGGFTKSFTKTLIHFNSFFKVRLINPLQ